MLSLRKGLKACGAASSEHVDGGRPPAGVQPLEADRDRASAGAAAHNDDGFDDAVGRLADSRRADGEGRPGWRLTAGLPGTGREHHPLQQMPVDVIGHPTGDMIEIAGAGEDLDGAAGEVLEQRSGVRQRRRRGGLVPEELVGDDPDARADGAARS